MKRDLQKDRDKMNELWDQEVIYDVNEIMEIAEHALNRAIKAELEVKRLSEDYEECRIDAEILHAENKRLREAFGSRSVYKAIRYYQKQGLCEENEYDELDKATNEILQGR